MATRRHANKHVMLAADRFWHYVDDLRCHAKLQGRLSMTKRTFVVKAVWDDEAKVFYCESDIFGLHVEAETIDEFEAVVLDVAIELIVANHISAADLAEKPMSELIPAILWQRPDAIPAAA